MSLDLVFAALADPGRRSMVERLSQGPASVSELAAPLPMSLSAVLQHLRVLQDSGLVISAKVGRVRTCRVDPAVLGAADQWFASRRGDLATKLDRLGAFLAQPSSDPTTEEMS